MNGQESGFVKLINWMYSQLWLSIENDVLKPLASWSEGIANWYIFNIVLPHVEVEEEAR
jgi:hypothetical protein